MSNERISLGGQGGQVFLRSRQLAGPGSRFTFSYDGGDGMTTLPEVRRSRPTGAYLIGFGSVLEETSPLMTC